MSNIGKILDEVLYELDRAETLHPDWPLDPLHQIAIVNEESGEATRAALRFVYEGGDLGEVRKELVQTMAMCLRMMENLDMVER